MKIGIRKFSPKKRISSRLSFKRRVRSVFRLPRGMRIFTDPKRYWYDKVYHKVTFDFGKLFR